MLGTTQTMWVWEPAIYLFLGGLAGGAFFATTVVRLWSKDRFSKVAVLGPWVSVFALIIGLLFLVVDVAKPFQAMMMWKSFTNFSSWMTIGAWLLFVAVIFIGLCAVFSTPKLVEILSKLWAGFGTYAKKISKVCMILGSIGGLGVAVYTGILLWSAHSIPLWNTPWIPTLFTISALDAGVSVVLAILLAEKDELAQVFKKRLSAALIVLIILEACTLAALLMMHMNGNTSQALAANTILHGDLHLQFWGLIICVGLIVPFILTVIDFMGLIKNEQLAHFLHIVAIVCALIGGFTLRFVILTAGIHGVLVSPDPYQAMMGVYNMIL